MFMSGVDDGSTLELQPRHDGTVKTNQWILKVGRKDDNDLILRNDTFVSRYHAHLTWRDDGWWLEDLKSTNGTFLENEADIFSDERVQNRVVPIELGQMFRVGRTWLRIQKTG
jgi:pSer/pThr/pTyr-binding forkhead associated (FHA) protein